MRSRYLTLLAGALVATLILTGAPGNPPAGDRPNIVVIDLEGLRAGHLSCNGTATAPAMCGLANDSLRFRSAVSQAALTAPSVASIFTGAYQPVHGVRVNETLPAWPVTLAEKLNASGYRTGGFVGVGNDGRWIAASRGYDQGFSTYGQRSYFLADNIVPAKDWITSGEDDRPFFAYVHGYDVLAYHRLSNFLAAAGIERRAHTDVFGDNRLSNLSVEGNGTNRLRNRSFLRMLDRDPYFHALAWRIRNTSEGLVIAGRDRSYRISGTELRYIRRVYDARIRRADRSIGRFLRWLRERGVYEDTIVVVTSNHGVTLGDREFDNGQLFGHGQLYPEQVHVPLILRIPGVEAGRVEEPVELVDLYPTLLAAAEIDAGWMLDRQLQGENLLRPGDRDGIAFSGMRESTAVRTQRWMLVSSRAMEDRLFEYGDGPRPSRRDTSGVAERLRERIEAWRQDVGLVRALLERNDSLPEYPSRRSGP